MNRPARLRGPVALLAAAMLAAPGTSLAIGCGETVVARVDDDGPAEDRVGTFEFEARASEVVSVTVGAPLRGGQPYLAWTLVDPSGRVVPTATGALVCAGQCETAPLPAAGTYTIAVLRLLPGTGCRYHVTLEAVSATADGLPNGPPHPACARERDGRPDGTRSLVAGDAADGLIDAAGETDTFTFSGAAADVRFISVEPQSGRDGHGTGFVPRWRLFGPDGAAVPTGDGQRSCAGGCATAPLASSGTFTIEVADAGLDARGWYTVHLDDDGGHHTTTTTTAPRNTTTSSTTTPSASTTTTSGPVQTPLPPPFELGRTVRLPPAPSAMPEELGAALAASGTTLVLGAPQDAADASDGGVVYVLELGAPGAAVAMQRAVLAKPGTRAAGDGFGAAVALVGDGVLVGAPGDDSAAADGGAAFLFGGASPLALHAPAPATGARFGSSVAALGGDLLIGAPGVGEVHLLSAATGEPLLSFHDPDAGAPNARFGFAVRALGTDVLVGAPGAAGVPGRAFLLEGGTGNVLHALQGPAPEAGDELGFAVEPAGGDIVVGAPGTGGSAGRAFLFSGATGLLLRTFDPPTPQAGDRFGATLAVDGSDLLVGAPGEGGSGAVHRFALATGQPLGVLRKDAPQPDDLFGAAVAVVGGRVLVGAPRDDAGTVDGGAAYLFAGATLEAVFRKRLSAAAFGAALVAAGSDLVAGAPLATGGAGSVSRVDLGSGAVESIIEIPTAGAPQLGFAVAPLASGLVAGAPFESDGRGAAHVVRGSALAATLADPDAMPGDQFGFSLGVLADAVVVGAPLHGERDTGLVRLFDATSGALRRTFRKPVPMTGDFFGASVAADGGGVLVGAPFDGTAVGDAGAAYLFAADTAELTRTFVAPTPASGDLFGAAVALGATRVVVGAPLADVGADDAGAAYVFDRASGAVELVLANPAPARDAEFGRAVAVLGDDIAVGAPLADGHGIDTGAVYLFDATTGALREAIASPTQGDFDHFGFAVASAPDGLLVGAPGPSLVYLFRATGQAAPSVTALLGPLVEAAPQCGNGIVEGTEQCDDGNAIDTDDCRNDCTRGPCCTLDPLVVGRCDDHDPCTDDAFDSSTGCTHVDNGTCCTAASGCQTGTCRICNGCFLFPWDCCSQGSACIPVDPECVGKECVDAALCHCEGGLACDAETVPEAIGTLFAGACDQLRLEASVAPGGSSTRDDLVVARSRARKARRMTRQAAKATRKLASRGVLSKECGTTLLGKIRSVKRAIPKGRHLRRCVRGR